MMNSIAICAWICHVALSYDVALVTFHGGEASNEINNIHKYEFGSHPDQFVFGGELIDNEKSTDLRSLRGMVYNAVADELYYVNAYQHDSKLLRAKGVSTGTVFGEVIPVAYLDHPYGIALGNGTVYITNQNTNTLTRYFTLNFQMPQPVFATVGDPRGVAVDKFGNVWVADKVTNSIIRYTPTGRPNLQVPVTWPIAVVIYKDVIYATSRTGSKSVLTIDVNTGKLIPNRVYSFPSPRGLTCGVVPHEATDSLYVMTQRPNMIHRFYLNNMSYVGPVLSEPLADIPQHIIIVPSKNGEQPPKEEKKKKDKKDKKKKDKKDKDKKDDKKDSKKSG